MLPAPLHNAGSALTTELDNQSLSHNDDDHHRHNSSDSNSNKKDCNNASIRTTHTHNELTGMNP